MSVTLTRVTSEVTEFTLTATDPDGAPAALTGAKVAILPKRRGPTNGTVWTTATYAAGTVTVRLAGPDADPTGATLIVPEAGGDLWALPLGITDYNPVKITRVYLLGGLPGGPVTGGVPFVGTIAGLSGTLTAQAVVDALAGPLDAAYATDTALTTGLAGKVDTADARLTNSRAPTGGAGGALSGTYPNPGLNTSALDTAAAALVPATSGSATAGALGTAYAVFDAGPIDIRKRGVTPSALGSTAADHTSGLNTAFALGGHHYLPLGQYNISAPLVLAPNTAVTVHPLAVIRLADGARCNMITTDGSLSTNGAIRWRGGTIDGNDANQGDESLDGNNFDVTKGFRIVKAQNLDIGELTVRQTRGHGINHWNCTNVWVHDVRFEQGHSTVQPSGGKRRDGVTGMSTNVLVENISGYTGDDMVCILAGVAWAGADVTPQTVDHATIRNIRAETDGGYGTWHAVAAYTQNGSTITSLTIDGVSGQSERAHVSVGSYKDAADAGSVRSGRIRNLTVSNVTGIVNSDVEAFVYLTFLDAPNVTLSGVSRYIFDGAYNLPTIIVNACTMDTLNGVNLAVDDTNGSDRSLILVQEAGGTAVKSVSLAGCTARLRNVPTSTQAVLYQKDSSNLTNETRLSIAGGTTGSVDGTFASVKANGGAKVVPWSFDIFSTVAQMTARPGARFTDTTAGPQVCVTSGQWRPFRSSINAAWALMSPTAAVAEEAVPRPLVSGSTFSWASGQMLLTYWIAQQDATWSKVQTAVAGTAAAATPTLCRVGIFSVDAATGDLTLIGSTANSVSLWASTNSNYDTSLSASVSLTAGLTYAVGVLIVTAVARPILQAGTTNTTTAIHARSPRLDGSVTGLSDLPSSVSAASVANGNQRPYAALLP